MHLSPGLWVSNTARLRSIVEMVARASFQRRREPMDAALWYASECQKRPSKCQKSSSTRSVAQDTAVGEAFLCCCYFVIVLLFLNICVSIDKVRTGAQDAAVGGAFQGQA